PELASAYVEYWNALKTAGNAQDATLRTADKERHVIDLGSTELDLWFSPNTKQQTKPAKNPALPVDLHEVYDAIAAAKHAVLFLVFQPGTPSVLDAIASAQSANPDLFVRGAATDPNAVDQYNVDLYHRTGATLDVVAAAAIDDQFGFWEQELLKTPG